MKELKFLSTSFCISEQGVRVDFFKVCWLAVFRDFVYGKAYFKLYSVLNWKPIKFFNWGWCGNTWKNG